MNYLDKFDEKNIEKFRLMTLKEYDDQKKGVLLFIFVWKI